MFCAAFPLAHQSGADVEVTGEHSLARLLAPADGANPVERKFLDRRQAHFVERFHGALVQDARGAEALGGFVNRRQCVAAIPFSHDIRSPVTFRFSSPQ